MMYVAINEIKVNKSFTFMNNYVVAGITLCYKKILKRKEKKYIHIPNTGMVGKPGSAAGMR